MTSKTYTVRGMTCAHCVAAVTTEVRAIDGVTDAHVDLGTGSLTVTAQEAIRDAAVEAAVQEAGYALTD